MAKAIPMSQIKAMFEPGYRERYFGHGAVRFFGSRYPASGYQGPGGIYFASSDQPPSGGRIYSVHHALPPDDMDTIVGSEVEDYGAMGGYRSLDSAKAAARRLADGNARTKRIASRSARRAGRR